MPLLSVAVSAGLLVLLSLLHCLMNRPVRYDAVDLEIIPANVFGPGQDRDTPCHYLQHFICLPHTTRTSLTGVYTSYTAARPHTILTVGVGATGVFDE